MHILLTGVTGYIGSHLLDSLLSRGHTVRVLTRPQSSNQPEFVRRLLRRKGVEVLHGTLLDNDVLARAPKGVDVVYHLAWRSNRPTKIKGRRSSTEEIMRANVGGTEHLLRACVKSRVKRFIYTSTVAVYGQSAYVERWPIKEEDLKLDVYGVGGFYERDYIKPKLMVESMIQRFSDKYGLEYVILRPTIVYGAGAQFAEIWVRGALQGRPWLEGQQQAQLIHIRDMVSALLLAAPPAEVANEAFNVAGGEVASDAEMKAIMRAAATRLNAEQKAREASPPRDTAPAFAVKGVLRYDLTKAKRLLGYTPRVTLREGLEEMVASVLKKKG